MTRRTLFSRPQGIWCRVAMMWLAGLVSTMAAPPTRSEAQAPPPITSSGLNTQVSAPINFPGGTQYNITGGTRPGAGPNLFHSFGQFGVPTATIANFLNETALPTANILGRVTGGSPSNIFGTIQTSGFGNANLFLMNPAGILFGPTATVNIGGMATFTTADYLRLADGKVFHATPTPPADALLSTAPVAVFGFLGSNPGAITVQGSQLSVAPGQSLSLVGGDIAVQGVAVEEGAAQPIQLSAPGGQISLASVASPGEITAGTLEPAPNLNGQSFGTLGTIQITEKSVIDSSGYNGGPVRIRGGRFIVDDSRISANVTGPASGQPGQTGTGIDIQMTEDVLIQNLAVLETNVTDQASPGIGSGGVRIRADHIEVVGVPDFDFETFLFPFTGIRSDVAPMSAGGKSGDITLDANSIHMKDASHLRANTESASNSGNITVKAAQNIESENNGRIATGSGGSEETGIFNTGNAGHIELTSTQGSILLATPFVTSQATLSSGNSGNITLNAPNGDILITNEGFVFNQVFGTGTLGKLQITAKNLTLRGASGIEGDNLTAQIPDNITVTLSERLSLEGASTIQTVAFRSAPAADLTVTAPEILIADGSRLSTETFRSGSGGRLNLITDSLQMTNGGQIRSGSTTPFASPGEPIEFPTGSGGTVTVQSASGPSQSIVIDGVGSGIFTDAQGIGAGGSINLAAQFVTIQNGGTISASTSETESSATGGSIMILAGQFVTLNNDASITASSTGPANAGDIVINAGQSYSSTNSSVTTAAAQASGGNITVTTPGVIQLTNSQINASVQGSTTTVGGNLTMRQGPKKSAYPLTHYDRDTFYYDTPGEMAVGLSGVTFTIGGDGKAARVVVENLNTDGLGTFARTPGK